MLTTDPNPLVGSVHPKAMPVILHSYDHDAWLRADWKEARQLVASYPSQLMAMAAAPPVEKPKVSADPAIDLFSRSA